PSTVGAWARAAGGIESARTATRRRASQRAMAGGIIRAAGNSGHRRLPMASSSESAAVRARLSHPGIDGDGHRPEPLPIFLDYLKDVAGQSVVDKFVKKAKDSTWYDLTPEERMRRRLHRPTWWGEPASTVDRATAMIPRLFYERLDEIGLD